MESNNLHKEEVLFPDFTSSGYSSILDKPITISVKNIDLQTGLNIVGSLSKTFIFHRILIKRSLRRLPQGSLREPTSKMWEGVYA
jgi:hypothetical protein